MGYMTYTGLHGVAPRWRMIYATRIYRRRLEEFKNALISSSKEKIQQQVSSKEFLNTSLIGPSAPPKTNEFGGRQVVGELEN